MTNESDLPPAPAPASAAEEDARRRADGSEQSEDDRHERDGGGGASPASPPSLADVHDQALAYLRDALPHPKLDKWLDERTARVAWRDFLFLIAGAVALGVVGYVETHADDPSARRGFSGEGGVDVDVDVRGIVDTGFILTRPVHAWLKVHRGWNDVLAAVNSIALILPSLYVARVTAWRGDYSLVFRVLAVQLLRSFCGWFTYLPPDAGYLQSYFDFPDVFQCFGVDCRRPPPDVVPPFVSFFSGHVATLLVAANHMWMTGHPRWALLHHALNAFQIVRLLATRGHYSIDIIIGWFVAVWASVPAGRVGRLYSRGELTSGESLAEFWPRDATEALERATGVRYLRMERRYSHMMERSRSGEFGEGWYDRRDETETVAKLLSERATAETEAVAKILHERAAELSERARVLQERLEENVRATVKAARDSLHSNGSGHGSGSEEGKKDQ